MSDTAQSAFAAQFTYPSDWIGFLRYLADGYLSDDLVDVIEMPWKWHAEYVEWQREQVTA